MNKAQTIAVTAIFLAFTLVIFGSMLKSHMEHRDRMQAYRECLQLQRYAVDAAAKSNGEVKLISTTTCWR